MFSLLSRRGFVTTRAALAKAKKKGGKETKKGSNAAAASEEPLEQLDPAALLADMTTQCQKTLSTFDAALKELKMGKSNPKIFDSLKVDGQNFNEVALTTMKTPTFLTVTVFDPAHTKKVVSSILSAGLNLNPQVDPNNAQLLKVAIPSTTSEMRAKTLKDMKSLMDSFKSNANQKDSLVSHRSSILKEVKNLEGSKDAIKKLTSDVDAIHKKFSDKLMEAFKQAEKQLK